MVFIVWSLHFIASELENPFGGDVNDLHMAEIQRVINMNLIMLVTNGSRNTPHLCVDYRVAIDRLSNKVRRRDVSKSFDTVIQDVKRNSRSPSRDSRSADEGALCTPRSLPSTDDDNPPESVQAEESVHVILPAGDTVESAGSSFLWDRLTDEPLSQARTVGLARPWVAPSACSGPSITMRLPEGDAQEVPMLRTEGEDLTLHGPILTLGERTQVRIEMPP